MMRKCVLCGSIQYKLLFTINTYTIVRCTKCTLVYTLPWPSQKELREFYKKFDYKTGFQFEKLVRNDAKRSLRNMLKLGYTKPSVLDLGCGAGFFLDEARKLGWTTYGVDSADIPVKYAREKLGLRVTKKNIFSFKASEKFSVISLHQVIEHVTDPFPLLRVASMHLTDEGLLCIATPNIESYLFYVLQERFNYFIPPEHVVYYSPNTLKKTLSKAGFQIVKTTTYGYPEDFGGIYRALRERNSRRPDMYTQKNHITKKKLKDRTERDKISVRKIKHLVFEEIIRMYSYRLLNIGHHGSMLEVYARKMKRAPMHQRQLQ